MSLFPDSSESDEAPAGAGRERADRVDSLAAWVNEIDARLRVAETATGDEKTAKELRKAVEAAAKHDPKLGERLGNRIDVLADRVATLATTVSTTAAALARKDGEIAALQRELEAGKTRLDAVAQPKAAPTSSAEVEDLRRAVASLSEQKLPRNIEGRIDEVKAALNVLAQRVETLSATVSTTASGLAGREGEVAALRRFVEDEHGAVSAEIAKLAALVDPAPVAELRAAVKTLSDGTRALERDGQRRYDAVKSALDTIVQRVETLTASGAAAASGLASGERDLAALRSAFDEETTRVDSLLVKLHQATGELSARVGELGGVAKSAAVDELGARMAEVVTRVDALGTTVERTAATHASKEHEVAALGRRFEELDAQVDAGIRELREAVGRLAEDRRDPELEQRVAGLASSLETVTSGFASIDAAVTASREDARAAAVAFESRAAELAKRLDDVAAAAEGGSPTEELAGEVRTLADRVTAFAGQAQAGRAESAVATQAIAALEQRLEAIGRQLEQERETSTASVARADQAAETWARERASIVTLTDSLERRIAEVAARLEGVEGSPGDDGAVAELRSAVRTLEERLRAADAATETGKAEASASVTAVERRIAELDDRIEQGSLERARAASESAQAAETAARERASLASLVRDLEARIAEAAGTTAGSDERLAALERALADTTGTTGEHEAEVRELSDRFHEASARVDALVGELQGALRTMPAPVSADAVEQGLGELAARLDGLEQSKAAAALEIARASATWAEERATLRAELESIAQGSADSGDEHASIRARVDELAETIEAAATLGREHEPSPEVRERLERVEHEREALAAELASATAFWSSGLGALESRLSEVASAKEQAARKVDDEVVRALFDLARRLDAVEQGHAADDAEITRATTSWAAEREYLAAGLDELARRLDGLDTGGTALPATTSPTDETVDGRFRLELRALELRMEHAEAAARENREAVLVQLERLASRVEWRLQRLETGEAEDALPQPEDGPLAQVVQIHGSDA